MKNINKIKVVLISIVALTMAGCGGGGVKAGDSPATVSRAAGFSEVTPAQLSAAAKATPKEGSVIQSNVNNVPGLGLDTTKTTLSFKQVAGGQDVSLSVRDSVFRETLTENGVEATANFYQKSVTGGDFYAIGVVANYDTSTGDYLSFGLWAYEPSSTDTEEIGFYVDGGDPFTAAHISTLSGESTYAGFALGYYKELDTIETIFTADVALTANFNTNTISGAINNFNADGYQVGDLVIINLSPAIISTTEVGGFWTGNTVVTGNADGDSYTGKWGGQFYGNGATSTDKPEFASGTFGGSNNNGSVSFVGGFGAGKQ